MQRPDRIIQIATAFYESCILLTACELNVFGKIAELSRADVRRLAVELELNERGLRLLLDACVAIGLLEKQGELYRNTPESELFLVPGSAANLSDALQYNRDVYPLWGRLKEFVRTGRPVEKPAIHLGEDRERTRNFVMAMHSRAMAMGQVVLSGMDLSGRRQLLDVGGGPGTYSMFLAKKYPSLRCTVIDLPEVSQFAGELINEWGLSERITILSGDYHTMPFPDGNDVILFFGVLHQESPESICLLLRKAYNSMVKGGIIYVMDMMTDSSHTNPKFSALFAVNMALTTEHGWVFADTELEKWCLEAGFSEFKVTPLPPPVPHWLASARKNN